MNTWILRFTLVLLPLFTQSFAQEIQDWLGIYNPLLKKYVFLGEKRGIQTTLVDYEGLRKDTHFRKALYDLSRMPSFDTFSREDQLAMWINAYNILVLKLIVENPEIQSIKDLDSVFNSIWKQKVGVVAGKQYALDEIEHEIIRPQFQDPRTHFALNCASISCPNLANFGYEGKYLDQQLNHQAQQFLSNPTKGLSIFPGKEKIYLSKIFSWYGADFTPSVGQWLAKNRYIPEEQAAYSLSYMTYDWALNSLNKR